jgi:hypothetical protein
MSMPKSVYGAAIATAAALFIQRWLVHHRIGR